MRQERLCYDADREARNPDQVIRLRESMSIVFVHDYVEPNGLSIRENNLNREHVIPLGSIVEVVYDDRDEDEDSQTFGLRLFVVNHSRDCDGTPLYDLSFSRTAFKDHQELVEAEKSGDRLATLLRWQASGRLLRHYSVECLKIIPQEPRVSKNS